MRAELIGGPCDGNTVDVDARTRIVNIDMPRLDLKAVWREFDVPEPEEPEPFRVGKYVRRGDDFVWQGER